LAQRVLRVQLVADVVIELKRRGRQGRQEGTSVWNSRQQRDIAIPSGQSVGHHVSFAWTIFHTKIISKQLAYPLVLRNRRQALVQHELEGVVIGADDEGAPPQIWSPMVNGLDEPNKLALVSRRLEVPGCKGATEECNGTPLLM